MKNGFGVMGGLRIKILTQSYILESTIVDLTPGPSPKERGARNGYSSDYVL